MQFPKNSKKQHNIHFNKKFMRIGITTEIMDIYHITVSFFQYQLTHRVNVFQMNIQVF